VSTFFLLFFSSFFSQVIHNASKRHAKYAIENQSQRGLPRKTHKGGRPRKIVFGKGEEKPLKSKKKG
jgi:hypothetical protein